MATHDLTHVLLSWPKHLGNIEEVQPVSPRRSWIQLAKTGSFTSNRYGKFSITKTDLQQMLHNFQNVTPASPTELPIDYDHLSMDPKKPGDGIAAGWVKSLELRNDGNELWAEVNWTEPGADRIAKGEYRFVSPSFVKDHTHKDGRKIGTTLLAAAITNHPFLEGMQALTLYNFSAMGDLGVAVDSLDLTKPRSEYPGGKYPSELEKEGDDGEQRMISIRAQGKAADREMAKAHKDELDAYKKVARLDDTLSKIEVAVDRIDPGGAAGRLTNPKDKAKVARLREQHRALKEQLRAAEKEYRKLGRVYDKAYKKATGEERDWSAAYDDSINLVAVGIGQMVLELSELGQRVMIAPGNARTMDEIGATFEIAEVVGAGDDAFVALKDVNGVAHKWFRATELLPASATPMPVGPNLQPGPAAAGTHPAVAEQIAPKASEDETKPADAAAEPPAEEDDIEEQAEPAEGEAEEATDEGEAPEAEAEDEDEEDSPLKKAVKALVEAFTTGEKKRVTNMMRFMLRNEANEEIEVTAEQLESAGIRIVPEGASVIDTKELVDLRGQVKNLSSQVETLAAATEASEKAATALELKMELDRLSTGGFITKPMREYAEKKWSDTTDLAGFKEWASAFTMPIVKLNQEHGSSADVGAPEKEATGQLISLANTIAKERGISLREAVIQASKQMPDAAELYREQFATQ